MIDLIHTNDAGEDYNMSAAVREMNDKILACMKRVIEDRSPGTRVKVDEETWLVSGEGFS